MKTLIDLDEKQLRDLDRLAAQANRSRASLLREAVATYLEKSHGVGAADAFGLWGKRKGDGLAYQKKLRAEW